MSGANWPRVMAGVALDALVFLLVGPLVGTAVFLIAFGIFSGDISRGLSALAMMAIYFPLFILGYALAWKAALAAGVLVGVASAWANDSRVVLAFAAAAGAITSALLVSPLADPEGDIVAAVAFAGAAASVICAWLVRRMRLPRPQTAAAQ